MAKKRSSGTTKKVTRRLPAKKNSAKKKASRKSPKKSRKTITAKAGKSASKKEKSDSVDDVLKKFVRERASLDVHLSSLDKKIADLEKKTKLYKEQLVALGNDKEATLDSIAKIDSRRDLEVSELLAKLGVKVTEVRPPAATTTVVFDVKPSDESGEGSNNGEASRLDSAELQD